MMSMLILFLAIANANQCLSTLTKKYMLKDVDQTALQALIDSIACPASLDTTAAVCSQDFTTAADAAIGVGVTDCDGSNGSITGADVCDTCTDASTPCTDSKCDMACRDHSDCGATDSTQMLYCSSRTDRIENNNQPILAEWTSAEDTANPQGSRLWDDKGRCRPHTECSYFHDAIYSCMSQTCLDATDESGLVFEVDFHRPCPNLMNKIELCTQDSDCGGDKTKGGDGYCSKGNWKVCYENFFCCAANEGILSYGNIVPDEFGTQCKGDCNTLYKCTNSGEIWDLTQNQCVADTTANTRRFLSLAGKNDQQQGNIDKAKTDGKLEGSIRAIDPASTTTTTNTGSGAAALGVTLSFLLALFY